MQNKDSKASFIFSKFLTFC